MRPSQPQLAATSAQKPGSSDISSDVLDILIKDKQRLEVQTWTDEQIRRIPNEGLAELAYQLSHPLRSEFSSESTFIVYWRVQRQKYGLRAEGREEIISKNSTDQDNQFKQEWNASPALREEFNGNFSIYAAFKRADLKGRVRICKSPVQTVGQG